MKRSTLEKPTSNAFALLMGSSTKKKQRAIVRSSTTTSRFVPCPVGCGKHILDKDINSHLDVCISAQTPTDHVNDTCDDTGAINHVSQSPSTPLSQQTIHNECKELSTSHGTTETNTQDSLSQQQESSNVFSHMMKQSAKVFSPIETTKLYQHFHLNADGTLRLKCYATSTTIPKEESDLTTTNAKWSETIQLKVSTTNKDKAVKGTQSPPFQQQQQQPLIVELTISSEIPSAEETKGYNPRLVRRHSRLSIPVLKSMLQKSIRRRKPLPSVRVAMELGDKSMENLLRRLPIIILEDSTLHPNFPFLTWLMMAHSKGFRLNQFLLTMVYTTVYEMASCPWQDEIVNDTNNNGHENETATPTISGSSLTLESFHPNNNDPSGAVLKKDYEIIVWSMLVRARYGGMGGDIRMLHAFAKQWKRRFEDKNTNIPPIVQQRLAATVSSSNPAALQWTMIPYLIHQSARKQSTSRVQPMIEQGLASLTFSDTTTEGVDFHCSSIIDYILSDSTLVHKCEEKFEKIVGLGPLPQGHADRKAWLERILKRCMWKYSAGVNRRLPMTMMIHSENDDSKQETSPMEAVWQDIVQTKAKQFAEQYVKDRLA